MRRYAIIIGLAAIAMTSRPGMGDDGRVAIPVFNPEQQQGDVKVTLLQVSRVTTFSRQYVKDPPEAGVLAIPGMEVLYQIERTGDAPLGRLTLGGVHCSVDGTPVLPIDSVVGGGLGTTSPWTATDRVSDFDMPAVASPERARLIRSYQRGVVLDRDRVNLDIVVGFDGVKLFVFENVPVN